ncbi:cytochrome d ubiquinol oxidase subunit II [Amycolatopsis australiensis]|uniref:Cytochrome d ubiquinol oxidase subunit II n=1 Tax=Amycolatopsis australiensis TaxID=546364 RepID=A0A1K1T8E3_9PSEU|nr:cytochrome d ubiquinol oxidase subunit II [Amycolatopsis australiensis]SFW42345.1 cytochrome d ubiquinol oxidase subunit II [Amycolatopsis australiensis]SFW92639.1 cytochrome d ubiquinol oxidase subunit II [Amycolatopsis australiensis]
MVTFWWCVLGLLTCGYFALAGYDYGVGMLLPSFEAGERKRRQTLGALGPFFLANEVWLVAAVGLLFGAFPHLEGQVFAGAYVLVVTLLLGLVTFTASMQLRSRRPDAPRGAWTAGIVGGALVTALSWGLFLGNLVYGLPPVADVLALFNPYAVLWGLGFVALFCLQGAAFLAVRAPAELTGRAVRLARSFTAPVLAFLVIATAWGFFALNGVTPFGAAVVALAFSALGAVWWGLRARRYRVALVGAMVLSACPALLVGLLRFPTVFVSSAHTLDVTEAATAPGTLGVLGWFAAPSVVVLVAVQWLTWRAHRHPVDQRSLLHF